MKRVPATIPSSVFCFCFSFLEAPSFPPFYNVLSDVYFSIVGFWSLISLFPQGFLIKASVFVRP